jgi:hypothetical protein
MNIYMHCSLLLLLLLRTICGSIAWCLASLLPSSYRRFTSPQSM